MVFRSQQSCALLQATNLATSLKSHGYSITPTAESSDTAPAMKPETQHLKSKIATLVGLTAGPAHSPDVNPPLRQILVPSEILVPIFQCTLAHRILTLPLLPRRAVRQAWPAPPERRPWPVLQTVVCKHA